MIEGIEELYQRIAQHMVDELPDGWQRAKLDGVFYPKGSSFYGAYVSRSGQELTFASLPAIRALTELRAKFKDSGQRVWGQASFFLNADGSFNVKWGYDKCDENGDTIWNGDDWEARQERHGTHPMQ